VVERTLVHSVKNRRSGCRNEAIENSRDLLHARGEDRPHDRREFASTQATQDFQRVIEMCPVQLQGLGNDF
jgi:hypothetical protein